jgi:hypothetical protein
MLDRMGLPQSEAFTKRVEEARRLLPPRAWVTPQRQRPVAGKPTHMRDSACESNSILDPSRRLVKESTCKHEHLVQAIETPFPDAQDRLTLSPECEAAIDLMCSMADPDLANWRQQQVLELAKIAHKCKPLTAQWFAEAGDVPQGVKSLRASFNLVFIAVVLEAIDWPDKGLCASLLRGFQLYGDLSGDDSGIFRQKSEQEMADERPAFDKASAELGNHSANLQWLERCHSITLAQVTSTAQTGKRKSSGDGVDADDTREALLHEVMRETLDQQRHVFIGPAMTKEAMMAKHTVNGVFMTRPLPRFGIHQGFKVNSEGELVMKTRCIDDSKIAGVNAGTLLSEALVMPTFEFILKVGGHICAKSNDNPEFYLVLCCV